MPTIQNTTITVSGGITGTLWMPPITGWRETSRTFALRCDPPSWHHGQRVESIREALEQVAANDGDFQTAGKLTADTYIVIRRHCAGDRVWERTLYVVDFPEALADLVDFDVYSYDEEEE